MLARKLSTTAMTCNHHGVLALAQPRFLARDIPKVAVETCGSVSARYVSAVL